MGNPAASLQIFDPGQLGSAMLRSLTNWISGEELQPEVDPYSVQDKYNRQRTDVRDRAGDVGFQGAYRPKEVRGTDEFDRDDLATLRRRVDQISIETVSSLSTTWNTIAQRHQTSLDTFSQAMAKATDDSVWKGSARDAALGAVNGYTAEAAQVTNAAKLTGNKLSELQTGLEPTKQLVPHPPEHRSGIDNARAWIAGRGWRNDDVAEYNARTEALRVLKTVYAPVVLETDTNVPQIPRPAQTTKPGDPKVGPGPGDGGGGNGGGGGGTGTGNNGDQKPTGTENPEQDSPVEENPDESTNPSGTDNPTSTPQSTDTTPASTTPASTQTPTTPGSGTPSSPGPGPGGPGPGPGNPNAATPGPGRSIPGTPATGAPGAPAAARSSAPGAGRAGMPGMGGMGGARPGGKDDESSKGIPDYLINQENGEALTGLDSIGKTVPPVIGE
ncbi:hypothetical protein APR12_004870 [Nocardia amikacinitolerans]|uniref:hypothetical protein n=1 Tax=Nocardia amikacinitolerans TaxID=756689 RepID=UPI0008344108|nr:hypothetical protein [Nocardia amikacinitolerans]MCP2319502.1 hypothetical protein [Nocardia amikacinitolerans]